MPGDHGGPKLEQVRGSLSPGRANARTVAALTDNPGCSRRRVLDASGVKAYELAASLGHPVTRGQSPFAIVSGNRFEYRLKEGSDYGLLVESLRPFVDLPEDGLIVRDLNKVSGALFSPEWMKNRVMATDTALGEIASGAAEAPHIVDHPMLVFDLAGTPIHLEPDALAFRVGDQLELVEIKSYAVIDGQADPGKVSSTAGQSAVYLLALRATLERLGLDPDILRWSVILVAPRNFGRTPTAHRIPLRKKASALSRVLASVPRTAELLTHLPQTFTLDVDPDEELPPADRAVSLEAAVRSLDMLYVPGCLSACDMARFCRHQARVDDDPSRLGRDARDSLAGVERLGDVTRLAAGQVRKEEQQLIDVAEALMAGKSALDRARTRAAGGVTP